MKMQLCDLSRIFKGLHMLHSSAWEENSQSEANEIWDLITSMKAGCNWNHDDDKSIGQVNNRVYGDTETKDVNGPTKCIPGSNCD